ncbi:MAG: hypothetical protein KDA44_11860 [Planctomycetales bacterium]|nr:hypothetical protein [Planctomycetales bacterium]
MSQLRAAAGVSLDELFADFGRRGPAGCRVTACTADYRDVQPGDAFVAVLTDDADGHDHAHEAVRLGAAAVICERPIPVFDVPVYNVPDSRLAYGELCQALVDNPCERVKVIGVAGSHGKSSVVALLQSILHEADYEAGVLTSTHSFDGISLAPGWGEAPSPVDVALRLARIEAAGCTHALMEVDSVAMAQSRLAGVEFDSVCVTNVTTRRLDLHQTAENYRNAEHRALDQLSATGVAVLNADSPVCCRWLAELNSPSITFGFGDAAQITATVVEENAGETWFVLTAGDDSAAVRTTIVGREHVANCVAAATTALVQGIDLETIARGLEQVTKLPGRMERIDCGQDFPVYVDAANTADALAASLRTARSFAAGRVICVLGDQLPHSAQETASLNGVLRKLADVAIVTGRAAQALGVDRQHNEHDCVQIVADRGAAIACAAGFAERGDVVVVVGSSGRPRFAFGQKPQTGNDVDAIRKALYARQAPALRLVA